ncbi:MAG: hypothetical protein OM95_02125 [Bdellovibrio sp. ArHS]|uniref:beta strand repeat-containing protein n=1 Tax=Bdellovibrio sp. ArHS TaxID=1569284 RepID=UPI0005824552|nr:delta-60 repeat domain-containing protein [Bdellovibrio sp. ArHS]KHD89874.1 MAG: hypothetical protein OM95_02125 [Bdellovibrio sp. ArHS]
MAILGRFGIIAIAIFMLSACGGTLSIESAAQKSPILGGGGALYKPELTLEFISIEPNTLSSTLTPLIKGRSKHSDSYAVTLYSDSTCSVPIGAGSAASFPVGGIHALVIPNISTHIHARVFDLLGNYGPCESLVSYTSDTIAPALYQFKIDEPEYVNKTNLNYSVIGESAEAASYCLLENDTEPGNCNWQSPPLPVTLTSSAPHGFRSYTLFFKDAVGNISNRVFSNTVYVDIVPPANPSSPATVPPTPSSVLAPLIKGVVDLETSHVFIYSDNLCTDVLGQGTRDSFVTTGIQITVPVGATTSLFAQAKDRAGNSSSCTYLMDYVHQSGAITPLTIGYFSTTPLSPSANLTPKIKGYSSADVVNVNFYADSSCAGAIVGTGNKTDFEGAGISVTAKANEHTAIYAKGYDASLNPTSCVLMATYLHDNVAPTNVSAISHNIFFNSTSSSPTVSWSATTADAVSGVLKTEYSIGTTAGGTNVRAWTTLSATSPAVFSGLTLLDGGTYYINFRTTDKALNTSTVLSATGWTVDVTGPAAPPAWSSFVPSSPSATTTNPTAKGSVSADSTTVKLFSDAGCSSVIATGSKAEFEGAGISFSVLSNSEMAVYAKSFDAAGNASSCSFLANYRHDNQAPTFSGLVIHGGSYVNSTTVTLGVGAMTGEPTQYCLMTNSADVLSCSWQNLPIPSTINLTGGDGVKVLSAFVRDAAGNIASRVDSNTVTLDTVPPVWASPNVTYAATHTSATSSPAVSYSQAATDANLIKYEYAVGTGTAGASINDVVDWMQVTSSSFTVGGLALSDGVRYYIQLRAQDSAGNVTVSPINAGFLVNVNVPAPSFFAADPQSPSGASTSPRIKGYLDVVADVVTLFSDSSCSTQIGSGTKATFESTGVTISILPNTTTTIYAKATDTTINKSSVCSYMTNYVHDSQGPIPSVSVDDGTYSTSLTTSPLISWVGGGTDGGSGFNRFEFAIGTSPLTEDVKGWTSAGSSVSVTVTGLSLTANTRYYAKVRSVDNVGNISSVTMGDGWIIDTSGPTVAFTIPFENDTVISDKRTLLGACETGIEMQMTYSSNVLGPATVPCVNGEFSVDILIDGVDGARSVSATQVDAAGNSSGVITRSFLYKPTFTTLGDGLNGAVWSLASTNDGSRDILVGGAFTQLGDITLNRLARLKYSGDRVESFSIGTGFNNTVFSILPSKDGSGKFYVGGAYTDFDGITTADYLIRLNGDGSLDDSFVPVVVGGAVSALEYGPGTTIFAGGNFTSINGQATSAKLVQLNSDGSIVTTFNVSTGGVPNGEIKALRLSADGDSLFVGGNFTTYRGVTVNRLVKVNVADGAVAAGWATGATAGFTTASSYVHDIELAPDDDSEIYVSGNFTQYGATANSGLRIARLTANGALSATFNGAPGTTNGFNAGYVRDITPARDGTSDIYVAGEFTSYRGTPQSFFARLQANGALSATFVNRGFSASGYTNAVLVPPAGDNPYSDVLVGGAFTAYDAFGFARLLRLNADGTPDIGINIGAGIAGGSGLLKEIVEINDGSDRLFIGGSFTTYRGVSSPYIARINQDGSLDTSFVVGTGFNGEVSALYYDKSINKLYVAGAFTTYKGTTVNRIVRLNFDGSIDSAFAMGTGFNGRIYDITSVPGQPGKIYAGGEFTTYKGVSSARAIRLNADGSIDASFNVGSGFGGSYVYVIKPVNDGTNDVLMGGNFTSYNGTARNYLVRLKETGILSSSFNVGAGPGYASPATGAAIYDLAVASDGGIYVAGVFQKFQSQVRMGLVKIKASGALDNTFNVGSGLMYRYTASSTTVDRGYVTSLAVAKDGRVYATGAFTGYFSPYSGSAYPITVPRIIALNIDGSMDMSFGLGTGINATGWCLKSADDGSGDIFACGDFTTYNSLNRNGLVRIKENGNTN